MAPGRLRSPTPPETVYVYEWLSIDIARERLRVYLHDTVIDEHVLDVPPP